MLTAAVALCSACKDDPVLRTEVRVEITSEISVDEVEILVRNENYLWDRLAFPLEKDITREPFILQLEPGAINGEFLLYAKGFDQGVYVAGQSLVLRYQKDQVVERELRLNADFVATDADEDGFIRCAAGIDASTCDCDDRDALVNPFTPEICGDDIDNDCSGGYPPDGSGCPCTEDVPCTNLDAEFIELAGNGACTLGVLRCVDGVLSESCEGASPIRNPGDTPEIPNNFIDDDCDGVVDEGGACDPSLFPGGRVCHRGFVDDTRNSNVDPIFQELLAGIEQPGLQASFLARGVCAPGGAAPGRQQCEPTTRTWALTCDGDIRPQRPPLPSEVDSLAPGDTVDPSSFTGVGFVELRLPGVVDPDGNPVDQCDGADNNCDGSFDEAPAFDSDGDGYTRCGTPVSFPPPATPGDPLLPVRDQPGLQDDFIDCNDSDSAINPGATELCGDTVDNDCFCDHGGAAVVGEPRFRVDGTFNCTSTQAFLNCSLPAPRSDPTDPGFCSDPDDGFPVYYWGYKNNAAGEKACYTCPSQYGLSCAADGACATKDADCCPCAAFPEPPEPGSFDLSQIRPLCGDAAPDSCTCTTAAVWEPLEVGQDGFDDCAGFACAGFYWGIENNVCFLVRNAIDADVACAGKPFCDGSGGDCCDPSDPATCCEEPGFVCAGFVPADPSPATLGSPAAQASKGAEDVARPVCNLAAGGCFDQAPPVYNPQGLGVDLFNECNSSFVCSDESGTAYYAGISGSPAQCFTRADVTNNACDGTGDCQDQAEACGAQPPGNPVSRDSSRQCKIPTGGCTGTTAPVYGQNVTRGQDPYDDCAGAATCCDGQCCGQRGATCSSTQQCEVGLTCVDGVCCDGACNSPCEACAQALTGVADGTCAPINSFATDTVPSSNLCTASAGCANPPCLCDGAGSCLGATSASCSADSQCARGFCVDGFCCENACTAACDGCSNTLTGLANGTCGPFDDPGTDIDPPNACSGTSGCGGVDCACVPVSGPDSQCRRGQGSTCTADNQCRSGFCVDGFCCNNGCDGPCRACSAALSVAANGTCAAVSALGTDTNGESPAVTTCGGGTGCTGDDCVCQPGTGNCLDRSGTCVVGTDCPSGNCVENQCCNTACDGVCESCVGTLTGGADGTCLPIQNNTDTQPSLLCSGNTGCSGNACICESGTCNGDIGSTCSSAADCHGGNCVDGVCCESACNGACQACSAAVKGFGLDGICEDLPVGSDDNFPAGICVGTSSCDGNGNCLREQGVSCTAGNQCLSGFCVDGVCCEGACGGPCRACSQTLNGTANGQCLPRTSPGVDTDGRTGTTTCGGAIGCNGDCSCDNAGNCEAGNSVACASPSDCLSGNCVDGVCCATACGASCDRCDLPSLEGVCSIVSAGTPGVPACTDPGNGDYLCNGAAASCPATCASNDALCETNFFCNGSDCIQKSADGGTCSRPGECQSGFCVEGFCCNAACGAPCDSCRNARTGLLDGTCAPVTDGLAGDPACSGNLLCTGTSASCPATCTLDVDCVAGYFCDSGSCVLKAAQGQPCTSGNECQSTFCVDNVCCNTACSGECDSCSAALKGGGSNGVCGATAAGTDPDGDCTAELAYCVGGPGVAASNCDTTCDPNDDGQCVPGAFCDATQNPDVCVADLPNGDACENGGDCQSGFCVDGVCCNEACDGACEGCSDFFTGITNGVCGSFGSGTDPESECGNYFCSLNGCNDNCESNDDLLCKMDTYCFEVGGPANDQCRATEIDGVACENLGDCQSGFCVDGVCCEALCDGECEACIGALTGAADGDCRPITDGTDPESECGGGLACNGGACPPGSTCMGATLCDGDTNDCEDGFYCDSGGTCVTSIGTGSEPDLTCVGFEGESCTSTVAFEEAGAFVCCDGACGEGANDCESCFGARTGGSDGTCAVVSDGLPGDPVCAGGAFLCDGTQATCPTTCVDDGDCGAAFYCDGTSTCVPDEIAGTTCDRPEMCATAGGCVENVCCNGACDQTCESCLGALTGGSDGTCAPVSAGGIDDVVTGVGQVVCDSTGVGCISNACQCTGNAAGLGECLNATGESCTDNSQCWSDNCDTNQCQP